MRLTNSISRLARPAFVFISICLLCTTVLAQDEKRGQQAAPTSAEKAQKVVQRGLEVAGGDNYLKVQTLIGRGIFSQYRDGSPADPAKFVDYIVYPDKERTEFTSGGIRTILGNSSGKGWIFDGSVKNLKDQKAEQLEDFNRSMKTGFENLLRGWWRKEGATLSYIGRREAGLARRNETIRLTYPDGFWIEYEFDAKEGSPAKVIYQHRRKNPDTDEMEEITEEDRLLKPLTIDGILTFFVVDHFINGKQTSRINYDSVEYNRPIADSLFDKPANIKNLR
jgi:hypothetical protein